MINNATLRLNDYGLGCKDIGLCLITGLTCIPYAQRHWALAKQNSRYSVWHKVLAVLESIPVGGGFVALIERVSVFVISFFSSKQKLEISLKDYPKGDVGNATALEFISCVNPTLFKGITPLTKEEAQEFLDRGGTLNIITPEKIQTQRINIRDGVQVITGCNSGLNRSQVAAAVVRYLGIKILGVLAGGDSAMNPEGDIHTFVDPSEGQSAANFRNRFKKSKLQQVGTKEIGSFVEDPEDISRARTFYQDFINKIHLATHFITFSSSGPSVMRRLLLRPGRSLNGFTISYSPLADEVAHPRVSGVARDSDEAYRLFAEKLTGCFNVI